MRHDVAELRRLAVAIAARQRTRTNRVEIAYDAAGRPYEHVRAAELLEFGRAVLDAVCDAAPVGSAWAVEHAAAEIRKGLEP